MFMSCNLEPNRMFFCKQYCIVDLQVLRGICNHTGIVNQLAFHSAHLQESVRIVFKYLRWLNTVFQKLSYSLLNTFNFHAVKFKFIFKSVLNCSCILTYFLSNHDSFDGQCSVAVAL